MKHGDGWFQIVWKAFVDVCDLFYRAGSFHRAQLNKLKVQFGLIIDLKGLVAA